VVRSIVTSLRMLLAVTLLVGVLYPLAVWGVGQVAFSSRANGSLVTVDGDPVGSSLIGQSFEGPEWFVGRPDAFDPSASGPSNLGPTNPALGAVVRERLDAVSAADDPAGPVPVEAVTGSGSGLDPHISPAYARQQAPRVAAARGLPLSDVLALIDAHTEGRTWGFLGEPRVNVLLINLALERLASGS
jgi:K+-transporting ATPase ATPase C chain